MANGESAVRYLVSEGPNDGEKSPGLRNEGLSHGMQGGGNGRGAERKARGPEEAQGCIRLAI